MLSLQQLASALGGDVAGDQVLAPGPEHGPTDRSMSVKVGLDDYIVHSFANDTWQECRDYIDGKIGAPKGEPAKRTGPIGNMPPRVKAEPTSYTYFNADGTPRLRVNRSITKDFWQEHHDGKGWVKGGGSQPRVPYRLPEILRAPQAPVLIVEGEKDVENVMKLGECVVTTNAGGAGNWHPDLNQYFEGRQVYILPDHDEPGEKHAKKVFESLRGVASDVKIVRLPALAEKQDVSDWIDSGGTFEQLVDLLREAPRYEETAPKESPPNGRIRLVPFDEIKLSTHRRDLVKGIIPRVGLTVVWGKPKCGKSFWLFDCLMHVALGWEYRGRRIHQGPIIYCSFEGQTGLEARVEAFRLQRLDRQVGTVPFYLQPITLDLVKEHQALIATIRQTLGDSPPVAVALDTLNRSLAGSESSDEHMSAYVKAADAIREAFGCAVIIVHHCGHNDERMRGHSSLLGALDAEVSVRRDVENRIAVEVELSKDGPAGARVLCTLEAVTVGVDEDGDEITSCVVSPCEEGGSRPRAVLPKGLRLVHEAISAAVLEGGVTHRVGGDGPMVTAVQVRAARTIHNQRYVSTGDGDRTEAERKAWARNFKQAREANLIGAEHNEGQELIWLIS
jgi:5S rRNA maturation endonuclease (ribonuclease M5)